MQTAKRNSGDSPSIFRATRAAPTLAISGLLNVEKHRSAVLLCLLLLPRHGFFKKYFTPEKNYDNQEDIFLLQAVPQ